MKKCAWLIMLMLLLSAFCSPVMAMDNTVTATTSGYNDVTFSNGYNGFCLDKWLDMAYEGNEFIVTNTDDATNNVTGEPISQYLKIYFVDYFADNFEKDSNGFYKIKDAVNTQAVIYGFSDSDSKDWDYKPLTDVVEKYNSGRRIDDHGETIVFGDDKITFDFVVMKSSISEQQDFLGYKLTVETNIHEHKYGDQWTTDEEKHWHECECGDITDETEHTYSEDWNTDKDSHWHECECGSLKDNDSHTGGEASCKDPARCEVCEEYYGKTDKDNHTGETEIRNAKDATEENPGYTGDTYCNDCDTLLKKGKEIPILPKPVVPDEDEDLKENVPDNKEDKPEIIKPNNNNDDNNKTVDKKDPVTQKDTCKDDTKKVPDTGDNGFANLIITAVCSLICIIVMIVMVRKHYIMRNK